MDTSGPESPTYVYVVSYIRPDPKTGYFAGMWIGVYTTAAKAEEAIARLRRRPGFREYPDGFSVNCYRTDEDYDDPMFFTSWDESKPN